MQALRAVIFDMDGVIVNSEPLHERAFYEVLDQIGYSQNHGMRFSDYLGRSDFILWQDFVARHSPPYSLQDLLTRKRNRVIEAVRQQEPIFTGLPELVEKLSRVYRLAVASGSERPVIEAVLGLKELRRFFPVVVSSSEVKHGKPAPDIFLETARQLGVAPQNCWVIEDSKPGIAAAHAAGMQVIAITNTHPAHELKHATHVVSDYEAIGQLLLDPVYS